MVSVAKRYAQTHGLCVSNKKTPDNAPVVLMVSGGADSTALLLLAYYASLDLMDGCGKQRIAHDRLHVLHVNHELRGLDALEDEEFVVWLCKQLSIDCSVVRVDVAKAAQDDPSTNIENVGRKIRYTEAEKLCERLCKEQHVPLSSARILTAHTADDRAESFFMAAMKGAGTSGLSSIPRKRGRIVRPLMAFTHKQLCEYVRMHGIAWREDATNRDTHYLRAFVRHEVLPKLKERNNNLVQNLSATCDILSDEDAYLTRVAKQTYTKLVRSCDATTCVLDARKLVALDIAIARRCVRLAIEGFQQDIRLSSAHIANVLDMVAEQKGSCRLPQNIDVRVDHGLLFFRDAKAQNDYAHAEWLQVPGELVLSDGRALKAELIPCDASDKPQELAKRIAYESHETSCALDAFACGLSFDGGCLWVDTPHAGDVICPLGMHGQSKKLSDFLADKKVPVPLRKQQLIVRKAPQKEIVWVAGMRPDERVSCTPDTRFIVKLSLFGKKH